MKKTISVLACVALIPSAAGAAIISGASAKSFLYEPLKAESTITLEPGETIESVALAAPSRFSQTGLEWNPFFMEISVSHSLASEGKAFIRLSSRNPVYEPVLNIILEVKTSSGVFHKKTSLFFDVPYDKLDVLESSTLSKVLPPSVSVEVADPVESPKSRQEQTKNERSVKKDSERKPDVALTPKKTVLSQQTSPKKETLKKEPDAFGENGESKKSVESKSDSPLKSGKEKTDKKKRLSQDDGFSSSDAKTKDSLEIFMPELSMTPDENSDKNKEPKKAALDESKIQNDAKSKTLGTPVEKNVSGSANSTDPFYAELPYEQKSESKPEPTSEAPASPPIDPFVALSEEESPFSPDATLESSATESVVSETKPERPVRRQKPTPKNDPSSVENSGSSFSFVPGGIYGVGGILAVLIGVVVGGFFARKRKKSVPESEDEESIGSMDFGPSTIAELDNAAENWKKGYDANPGLGLGPSTQLADDEKTNAAATHFDDDEASTVAFHAESSDVATQFDAGFEPYSVVGEHEVSSSADFSADLVASLDMDFTSSSHQNEEPENLGLDISLPSFGGEAEIKKDENAEAFSFDCFSLESSTEFPTSVADAEHKDESWAWDLSMDSLALETSDAAVSMSVSPDHPDSPSRMNLELACLYAGNGDWSAFEEILAEVERYGEPSDLKEAARLRQLAGRA